MLAVLVLVGTIGIGCVTMLQVAGNLSGKSSTNDFCMGNVNGVAVFPTTIEDKVIGLQMKNLVAFVAIILVILETLIYIYIFMVVRDQNDAMIGKLNTSALQKRRHCNVVTLSGQMVCFAIEVISLVVAIFIINIDHDRLSGVPGTIFILTFQAPILTLTMIATSPELKSFASIFFESMLTN